MELSIFTKVRIALVVAVGVILLGYVGWPMLKPAAPLDAVVFFTANIDAAKLLLTIILAFIAGLAGGFIARPYTRQIGIIAAPAGLAAVSMRSGDMATLLKANATVELRHSVYTALSWEGVLWLAVVASGFFGAIIANIIWPGKSDKLIENDVLVPFYRDKKTFYMNVATSIATTVFLSHFIIKAIARDVIVNNQIASVVSQPANLQILFAVFVGFLACGFVSKYLLSSSYLWPAIASAIVCAVEMILAGRADSLNSLSQNWPIGFYFSGTSAVLPIQYIAFGTLGSVVGYWLAIRYAWWRKFVA